jgi:exodeoxyribonuclease VIII
MKPGIYPNIDNADYHGGPGVSNSMLKLLRDQTPMHLKAQRDAMNAANDNKPESKAFKVGRELHSLVLEPELFVKDYCMAFRRQDMPEAIDDRDVLVKMVEELNATRLPKLTKGGAKAEQISRIQAAYKEMDVFAHTAEELESMRGAELQSEIDRLNGRRDGLLSTSGSRHELAEILRANGKPVTLWSDVVAEWERHNGHRSILTPDMWDQVHRMRDAIMAHPAACALLTGCQGVAEYSAYARDTETRVLRRVRPDFWRRDGIVVDLKTTEDASPEGFARSIANYGYDMQHAYYLDTLSLAIEQSDLPADFEDYPHSAKQFVFIVVEKKPPYAVAVYVLDEESVTLGRAKYRKALDVYAECKSSGTWPGYGDFVQVIGLPQWHVRQNEHLVGAAA